MRNPASWISCLKRPKRNVRRTPSNLGRARVEISGHKPVLEALQRSSRRGSDSRKQGLRALASRPPSRVAAFQGAWRTRKPVLCQDRHPLQGGRLETGCIHGRMGVGRFPRRIRCFAEAVVRIDTPAAAWPTSQPGSASTCAPPWPPTSVPSSTARTSPSPRPAQSSRRLQRQVRPEAFRVDGTHKMSKSKDGPLLCSCRTLLNRFDDLIAQELSEISEPESALKFHPLLSRHGGIRSTFFLDVNRQGLTPSMAGTSIKRQLPSHNRTPAVTIANTVLMNEFISVGIMSANVIYFVALMAATRDLRTSPNPFSSESRLNGIGSDKEDVMNTIGFQSWSAAIMYPTLILPSYRRSWIKCWLAMVWPRRAPVTLVKSPPAEVHFAPKQSSAVDMHSLSESWRRKRFFANLISSGDGI